MVSTIRFYYDAIIAVALMAVLAIICGFIAAVITGGSSANFPVAAIAFLITGAYLFLAFGKFPADHYFHSPTHEGSVRMTNPTPARSQASRWDALLAENSILHKEHLDLLSSFTPPLSAQQTAQVEASAARRGSLPLKIQELVEEWADGREGLQQPWQRLQEQDYDRAK